MQGTELEALSRSLPVLRFYDSMEMHLSTAKHHHLQCDEFNENMPVTECLIKMPTLLHTLESHFLWYRMPLYCDHHIFLSDELAQEWCRPSDVPPLTDHAHSIRMSNPLVSLLWHPVILAAWSNEHSNPSPWQSDLNNASSYVLLRLMRGRCIRNGSQK